MKFTLVLLLLSSVVFAKILFEKENIDNYLDEKNPYFYQAIGELFVKRSQEKYEQGRLDLSLNALYETKDYPQSNSEYQEMMVVQPIYNGIKASAGYRMADGIQEYNNIKTSKQGEMLLNINIPLISMLHNTSENQYKIAKAQYATQESFSKVTYNVLELKRVLYREYYKLLYLHAIYETEKELLEKAEKNALFIQKQIGMGVKPAIASIEIKSIILQRKQTKIQAKNNYINQLQKFSRYLGIATQKFLATYSLPKLSHSIKSFSNTQIYSLKFLQRPEIQALKYKIKQVEEESQYNKLFAYPQVDLNLYGVRDLGYEKNGYKAVVNVSYSLQQRKYNGKKEMLQKEKLYLQSQQKRLVENIIIRYKNVLNSIDTKQSMIELSQEEIDLLIKLQKSEFKKYKEGMSNLVFLNTREIQTLQAKQKLLKHYLDLQFYKIELWYLQSNETQEIAKYESVSY